MLFGAFINLLYSWNVGRAHFIMFSTEVYYYNFEFSFEQVKTQYHWLENDLKVNDLYKHISHYNTLHYKQQATTPEALAERPWIITMGHKPMYCSTTDDDDCNSKYDAVSISLLLLMISF